MRFSKKNMVIFTVIGIIAASGTIVAILTIFPDYFIPIQEPNTTIQATQDTPLPNGTRIDVPPNTEHNNTLNIIIQNYSFTDSQGNFIQDPSHQPPVTTVKKGIPTPIDVVISPTLPKENGTVYVAVAFTYCAPLYYNNGQSRPCIEKNMDISLPQHIVQLNQHFDVTVTVPNNIPSGLYQIGIVARALAYSPDSDKPSNTSTDTPFWIRVI